MQRVRESYIYLPARTTKVWSNKNQKDQLQRAICHVMMARPCHVVLGINGWESLLNNLKQRVTTLEEIRELAGKQASDRDVYM